MTEEEANFALCCARFGNAVLLWKLGGKTKSPAAIIMYWLNAKFVTLPLTKHEVACVPILAMLFKYVCIYIQLLLYVHCVVYMWYVYVLNITPTYIT